MTSSLQTRGARRRLLVTTALVLGLGAASAAEAQTTPAATAPAEGAVYTPADFARFAPATALDMVNRVPAFTLRSDAVERGLGQATGNVLINGQRASNKSDDIFAQLGRIPAANVVRIEIRDAATLDIPGLSGQVANVVTKASQLRGRYSYRPEFRSRFTDPIWTRGDVSITGERGPLTYTLGLENNENHSGAGGDTYIYNPDWSVREERREFWTSNFRQPRATARFVYDGPGEDVGNLSLSYRDYRQDFEENGERMGPGLVDRDRTVIQTTDGYDYEISGDYEFAVGTGRLKLIGLDRRDDFDSLSEVTLDYADGRARTGDRITNDTVTTERIARGEYRWKQGGGDWQGSLEAAFNAYDNAGRAFLLQPSGVFQEFAFPNASARVEEARYEGILSYGRTLSPKLSFQLAAGAEYSELSQIGGGGQTRTFTRPKGQLTAVWQPSATTRVNMRLQRRVGQLNFGDFLASVDLNNGTQASGNPDLVPPQSWEGEVEVVQNRGAWGSMTWRAYAHLIDDIVDIIPIGPTGQSVGNIDQAIRYGLEWRGTFTMDPMGWRGVRIDTRAWVQRTEVEDPVTGETRPISNNLRYLASANLRHDIPETDWAYGFGLGTQRYAPTFRLNEVFHQYEIPLNGSAFIEHKNVHGLTVVARVGNAFSGESYLKRTSYQGRRIGPITGYERRDRTIGPIFSFEVRGRF